MGVVMIPPGKLPAGAGGEGGAPNAPDGGGGVVLPPGSMPQPAYFEPIDRLGRTRVTRYRFDLLDNDENLIGTLKAVVPGNGVEWSAYASVKGGGTVGVRDIGQVIDWLNVRVRPTVILESIGSEPNYEVPLGVFLPAAPVETWDDLGRMWEVELADKCSILDTDVPVGPQGTPVSFTAPIGTNVMSTVQVLINTTGESSVAIQPDPAAVLTSPLVWDLGTTTLQIINDMLSAVTYASLWCDGRGQYQAIPLVEPGARPPVYAATSPFSKSERSLMAPGWSNDRDIYVIPNRYVAVSQGSGDTEALKSVATNTDPLSPFSYKNRGNRWITRTVTGIEVASQADLDSRARMGLAQSTSISAKISASCLYLPDLLVNRVVRFTNPDAELDFLAIVTRVHVPFDALALSTCDLTQVLS